MNRRAVSIFILIDALGWELLKDRSFLEGIAKIKLPVKSVLGFSSGVIPSILTGQYPKEHRHWSLFFYSPQTSPFKWTQSIRWLPKKLSHSRLSRKVIEEVSKRLMGYSGYFETYLIPIEQLFLLDICEKKNIYAPSGIRNGRSIFDVLKEVRISYACFTYPLKDKEIFAKANESLKKGQCTFYFLYLSELDALLHSTCQDKERIHHAINAYEQKIAEFYSIAQSAFSQVRLFVFSDHGMAPVKESVNLKAEIDALRYRVPSDYLGFYDSTMARFWFFNPKAKEAILSLLRSKSCGRLLSREELQVYGVYFSDNMYGEAIFLMHTGVVINPSFMGNKAPQGMHGYDVNDTSMDAALVSNVELTQSIKDVKDFFSLMSPAPKKKKILYFLNSTVRAGAEEHILRLIKGIDKIKFEPILACPQELLEQIGEEIETQGIRAYPIRIRRWRNFREISKFLRLLNQVKPDIVHSHQFFATRFAAPLAKFAGVPVTIETAHLREAWRKGIKRLYWIDRFFYRYVDRIIAVSNAVGGYLIKEKYLSPEKIAIIHNGVDLNKFKPLRLGDSPLQGQSPHTFIIGVIGRLEPQKGHTYLFEAAKMLNGKLEHVTFLIAGEGSLREKLEDQCKRLGIEKHIKFLGFRNDIPSLLNELDLVVLPSLYEGMPLVALEAGAMAKPIIATNVDGCPEVVVQGKTGLIVEPANPESLKEALEKFITDSNFCMECGRNGRARIEKHFSQQKQITETERLYTDLVDA